MIGPIIDKLEKVAVRGGDKKLKPEYVSKNLQLLLDMNSFALINFYKTKHIKFLILLWNFRFQGSFLLKKFWETFFWQQESW